jgi:outer membrane protein assembly factor BamA
MLLLLSACNLTRNVPPKRYLLKKNIVEINNDKVSLDNLTPIIRQQPNQKTLGLNIKLRIYNSMDSLKVATRKQKKVDKFYKKVKKKQINVAEINEKRIKKARIKNKEFYTQKVYSDTIYEKITFSERIKYKFGQKPIVFDSLLFHKSIDQLSLYLKKTGYYYNTVKGSTSVSEKKRTIIPTYTISTGPVYIIDSVKVLDKEIITNYYNRYLKKSIASTGEDPLIGKPFDLNYLDEYREKVAKFMRDERVYKFYASNIKFIADTFKTTMKVNLTIKFEDRFVPDPNKKDSLIRVPFNVYQINNVYFHLADTLNFEGSFTDAIKKKEMDIKDPILPQFVATMNSVHYNEINYSRKKLKKNNLPKGSKDPFREIYLTYNGEKPWLKPGILELQNYLEHTNPYKEYYLDRSIRSLNQLGVFSSIKPELVEVPGTNKINVHYYLQPAKKRSFGFEPKFTTSFGLLGVSTSINYTDKNLFRGAQKMTLSFGGGFESQPQVFTDNTTRRTFNTFEIGPSIRFDLPGLFPVPVTAQSKRQKPRTVLTVAYNLENRDIFDRRVFQLNYLWKFFVDKTQVIQMGLPGASIIKFVNIQKSDAFINQLNQINDVFLNNTYSNQFIWQDFKFSWEYNNKDKDYKGSKKPFLNANIYYNATFDAAGNMLSLFKGRQDTLNGQYMFNNLAYSQFVRFDNQYIFTKKLPHKTSIHVKLNAGFGIPFGNTKTAMPYDYSFFAGGSNDNRGWRARALGPGAYKYHLDTNRLGTQIADIRIGGSLEYRFSMGSMLKGAVFSDFGNIWTYKEEQSRLGSQFHFKSFLPQIAVAVGAGIRMDLDFFIVRLDFGFPIYNPAFAQGAKWVFQDMLSKTDFRKTYYQEGMDHFGMTLDQVKKIMPKPFLPTINFGIGYPF